MRSCLISISSGELRSDFPHSDYTFQMKNLPDGRIKNNCLWAVIFTNNMTTESASYGQRGGWVFGQAAEADPSGYQRLTCSGKLVRVESTKTDRLNFARGVAAAYRVFVTGLHPVAGESSD